MTRQIKELVKLQLINLYGINVLRHTKEKKKKVRAVGLAACYVMLIAMACFFVGWMTWGCTILGLARVVPAYLIMISSLMILFFAIVKAKSVIFQENGYDILCSLPISQTAIVISRFARMYVENLLLTCVIMLSGMAVYGAMVKPDLSFYLIGSITTFVIPLLPVTIAAFLGALIALIASRMKHKNLVNICLTLLVTVGIMIGSFTLEKLEDSISLEILLNISGFLLKLIEKIYPPAVWFGNAMVNGDWLLCLICVLAELAVFAAAIAVISAKFHWICRGLYSVSAKHDYQMKRLKKGSVLSALYKRELKRYFASSNYVMNTIVGPVLAVVFSAVVLVMDPMELQNSLGIPFYMPLDLAGIAPFVLAVIFCIMTTTCTSISMEGKQWWIVKSLPVETRDILNSKLLLNLSLFAPFYLVSELLLILALKPDMTELFWMILAPAVLILFSCVWGITANLKFPVFHWENDVVIVKQSVSALVGGLGGALVVVLCMVAVIFVPKEYTNLLKTGICVAAGGVTWILYRRNNRVNLQEL